ncbi:MAG: anaerobic glycerol-3-phosphate dehydrogenase subunit B, partial [Desulfobacterales bacterium]|nr:anaerobic glycerol-3-phosphate dehydrogenase subunit B [Desulfobacterales bacterium]
QTGEIIFASGYLDLLGVFPPAEKKIWDDPWAGLERLKQEVPAHPLARIAPGQIKAALDEFLQFLADAGLPYRHSGEKNCTALTPLGTVKPTYAVPETMWPGVEALRVKAGCLLVDIRGLRGFSAQQVAEVWTRDWPQLSTLTIDFPESGHLSELYAETMARKLELLSYREQLADAIKPHLKAAGVVGLPAILGVRESAAVACSMTELIGVPVFEIPTMPPGVPGLRLKEIFGNRIPEVGVRLFREKRVVGVHREKDGAFTLSIDGGTGAETVRAARVLLAGGRFLGKGLVADPAGIREPLFDLPVTQPSSRNRWHRRFFLDSRGHRVNRAGLEIDANFRPLAENGRPAFENLYAAGSILAHQDWMRMKCGSGLAIATAFAAVEVIVAGKQSNSK